MALADVDVNGVEETAEILKRRNVKTTIHSVDVSVRGQVYAFAEDAVKQHGKVNVIIHNGGVALMEIK